MSANSLSYQRPAPHQRAARKLNSLLRQQGSIPTLIGIGIGIGVCYPFFRSGYLFLLDWAIGPHASNISNATLGLNGGLTISAPFVVVESMLSHLAQGPATWVPLFLVFPLAAYSASRLAGGSVWCQISAATLYSVNPFVFNRVFVGHVALLIGYALLPLAVRSAISTRIVWDVRLLSPALWWTLLSALSVHFCWIYGVVMVAVACSSRRDINKASRWLFINTAVFSLTCAYLLLPQIGTTLPVSIGQGSLAAFRTTADPRLGLFVNVLGLYGFWRRGPGPMLPKTFFTGWPFLLLVILLVAGAGTYSLFRNRNEPNSHEASTSLAPALLISGILGFLLAMGDQGPTGVLFRWAYIHIPFFNIMREPQKFLMLYALALSIFFGHGVNLLMTNAAKLKRAMYFLAGVLLSIAIPLLYTPTIFGGLDGQIALSKLPQSWSQANQLMGNGDGKILDLPWHEFLAFPFTAGRVILNPASTSFDRDVISGDNLQLSNFQSNSTSARSKYLQTLFANGENITNFGSLVAPLGVKFIVLAKTVDWSNYGWLNRQSDLRPILNSSDLEVWRNLSYEGVGARYSSISSVTSISQLIAIASHTHSDVAPFIVAQSEIKAETSLRSSRVKQVSPVQFNVPRGKGGWIAIDAPFETGWKAGTSVARVSATGTVLVRAGGSRATIIFTPWRLVRTGYAVSASVIALLIILVSGSNIVQAKRRRHQRPSGRADP
jgi:hypothetical protein